MRFFKIRRHNYTMVMNLVVLVTVITIALAVAVFRMRFIDMKQEQQNKAYDKYYAMIVSDRESSFWQSVYDSAYHAAIDKGIFVELFGSHTFRNYSRSDLLRIAIHSEVDGIIVEADESEEMTALIDEAIEVDIPVITVYGDNTKSTRTSYVGVSKFNLGKEYGNQVLEVVKELRRPAEVVVLVSSDSKEFGQNTLCSGIQNTIKNEKDINFPIEVNILAVDNTNAFSVEEFIRDIFTKQQVPDIIICLNELSTTCVYQAVVDFNKVGDVTILGYHNSEFIKKGIKRDVIYASLAVDTKLMGKYCIDALGEYYLRGNTSQYFSTEIFLLNKDNVEIYEEDGKDGN